MFVEPFSHFNPKTGRAPRPFAYRYKDVLYRARLILLDWDAATIRRVADTLDWLSMLRGSDASMNEIHKRHEDILIPQTAAYEERHAADIDDDDIYWNPADLTPPSRQYAPDASEIRLLFIAMRDLTLPTSKELPELSWSKVFAVASLACVGEVCTKFFRWQAMDKQLGDPPMRTSAEEFNEEAGLGLADAMEAICIAESLEGFEAKVADATIQQRKIEGAAHAEKGHAKGNAFKRRYLEFHDSREWNKIVDSRREFLKLHAAEAQALFRNPGDALEKALQNRTRSRKEETFLDP